MTFGVSRWFMLFAIWLHSGLFYSYPMLSCWFNFLDMKAVKELYENIVIERRRRYLLYFAFISRFNNHSVVTLCRWPAKQTIPLSVLARNQTKGFWTWNLGVARRGNGTQEESWLEKGADKQLAMGTDRCGRLRTQ